MQMTDELKDFLLGQLHVIVCIEADIGKGNEVLVVVKTSRDLAKALSDAAAPIEIGWIVHKTIHGPAICMAARSEDEKIGAFACETFFDISINEDISTMNLLAKQSQLRAALFDEELGIVKVVEIRWNEIQRLRVEQTIDRAEELFELCDDYDLIKAKELFYEDFPMEKLLRAAFGSKHSETKLK